MIDFVVEQSTNDRLFPRRNRSLKFLLIYFKFIFLIFFCYRRGLNVDEKFLMYAPSTIAAASVCAAFNGLTTNEQNQIWTRTELVSFLQGLTKVEPVRNGNDWAIYKNAPRSFETVLMDNTFAIVVVGVSLFSNGQTRTSF